MTAHPGSPNIFLLAREAYLLFSISSTSSLFPTTSVHLFGLPTLHNILLSSSSSRPLSGAAHNFGGFVFNPVVLSAVYAYATGNNVRE